VIRKVLAAVLALAVVGVTVGLVMRNMALVRELDDAYEVVRLLEGTIDTLRMEKGQLETRLANLSTVYAPVYFLSQSDEGYEVVPELRLIDTDSEAAPVISALLSEMAKGPTGQSPLYPVLPPGTRLLGVEIIDGVAYVDFSREMLDQSVGSPVESAVVEAIVRTVTEVEGVSAVQILVGGETIPSLAGHVDLSRPIRLARPDHEL
jgi:spore germination protein GerM